MTGRDSYQKFHDKEVNDPDIMLRGAQAIAEKYPWMAAGYWWNKLNNMNNLVDGFDGADSDADVEKITRRVNGEPDWDDPKEVKIWRESLKERQDNYRRSREIFPD